MKSINVGVLLFIVLFSSACASTKVTRVDVDEKIDLSGEWNDYDAQMISEEAVKDCLAAPWLAQFLKDQGRNPVVIVGDVLNRSSEHINSNVVTKYLEKELLSSGQVTFVASSTERDPIRDERDDQQRGYTDPETIKLHGKEKGADYMLIGSIDSIKDAVKGKYVMFYQMNLELVNLSTNEKSWIGQKQIKKKIEKKKFSL